MVRTDPLPDMPGQRRVALSTEPHWLQKTLQMAELGQLSWHRDRQQLTLDTTLLHLLGYAQDQPLPSQWQDWLHPADLKPFLQRLERFLRSRQPTLISEQRLKTAENRWRWTRLYTHKEALEGPVLRTLVGDIDNQQRQVARRERLSLYDPLTNLPNRHLLHDRLRTVLHQANRQGLPVALLYVEVHLPKASSRDPLLDDKLLLRISSRLQSQLRRGDTVARYGEDAFIMLMGPLRKAQDSEMLANRLLGTLSRPIRTGATSHQLSCHIGMALFPDHARRGDRLVEHAYQAMQAVKALGNDDYQYADR